MMIGKVTISRYEQLQNKLDDAITQEERQKAIVLIMHTLKEMEGYYDSLESRNHDLEIENKALKEKNR